MLLKCKRWILTSFQTEVLYKSSRKLNSNFNSHHYHVIFRRVTCRIVYRMQTFKRIVKWRALLIRRCKEFFFVSSETRSVEYCCKRGSLSFKDFEIFFLISVTFYGLKDPEMREGMKWRAVFFFKLCPL